MSLSQALNQFAQNLGRYPDGSIVGQVGVNDPLQSGNVTDSLTIGGDKNQDFLYRHGIGLTLTGPEDEATCM